MTDDCRVTCDSPWSPCIEHASGRVPTVVGEATFDTHPDGTQVEVSLTGVLDGYCDHLGQRKVLVTWGDGQYTATLLLPPTTLLTAPARTPS